MKKYIFQIKLFFFLALLLLVFYRSPYILLEGRFVSEEGSFWFRNSYINGPFYGFFQVFWESGYFNLWANIISIFATIPKLEYAPLVTVYFSLILKIYLIFYILNSDSEFLINLFQKILCCFIIIASPPIVPEIWLNTLNSQTFFALLAILIFFEKYNPKKKIFLLSPYILFLGGLSTLYVCVLSPFFLYKYINKKETSDLRNFIFIGVATFIQFIIFSYTKLFEMQHDLRFNISTEKIINYCYNVIVKSILGRETSQNIINYLSEFNSTILLIIFLISFLSFVGFVIKMQKNRTLLFLIIFFIIESLLVFIGSWSHQVQGRYASVPGVTLLFIFLHLAQSKFKKIRLLSLLVVFFSLISGLYEYKHNTKYPQFLMCLDCPNWKNEIDKWKMNKEYRIKIWNYPGKGMYLN